MTWVAAAVLLVFGLLPIANWIPGGHSAPWYQSVLDGWGSGGAILAGVAVIAGIVFRRRPQLWRAGAWARVAAWWRRRGAPADAVIALAVFAVCAVVAQTVLSARPLLIDEIIQVFQARIFASGRLWAPAAAHPEFTSSMHLLDWNGKVYGQFPAGGPAMLMLGTLVGAEWLVGPFFAAAGAFLFARLLRRIELRDGTALAALLLFAFAPFTVFLGGSMMNHVPETTWLIAAALALATANGDATARPGAAWLCGFSLGMAATIRPLDAVVFALPAAAWLLWRAAAPPPSPDGAARRGPHIAALLASGLGIALPIAALLYVNHAQTGDALRFGYIEMWGTSHEIGFHAAPWGPAHTPARGIELINLYLLRLQSYLFETPAPSLLFATAALALVPRITAFDRWTLVGSGGLLIAYFAYWHDGFYLGPRFMLPLAPWLALWTARLPAVLGMRGTPAPIVRGVVTAGVTGLVIALLVSVPIRAQQYRNGMLSMRFDVDRLARQAGVENAVVLVRESWGAQLVARLWGLGVSRTEAEHIYRSTDACELDHAITATEAGGGNAAALEQRLLPFRGDSARLVSLRGFPDTTVRFLPGSTLAPECSRRLVEDRAGFTVYPPFLLAHGNGDIFLRDLHARDTLALAEHPGRPVWLLTEDPKVGGGLRFVPLSRDSAAAEWRTE